MKNFFNQLKKLRGIILFLIFYLVYFFILENRDTVIWNTETFLDQYIPFNEYFVVFYLFWFVYVIIGCFYFIFIEDQLYDEMAKCIMIGLTLCLTFCLFVPNGINLRPSLNNDNIFQSLVLLIYALDTPTNVFPSIHVYNSVVICYGLNKTNLLKDRPVGKFVNILIASLIIISTMVLKQHAVIDVLAGLILAYVMIKAVEYYNRKHIKIKS